MMSLRSLLMSEQVVKADKAIDDQTSAFLFIPEYAGSRATAELADQTVKPKAVYRLAIDPGRPIPVLGAGSQWPVWKASTFICRQRCNVQRISVDSLLSMEIPVPDLGTQGAGRAY